MKCTKIYNARAQLLFCSLNLLFDDVTVVVCLKNVSDFVQKHVVSATNVSQFARARKRHEQQCVLVCHRL